jgi:hypothetical protein
LFGFFLVLGIKFIKFIKFRALHVLSILSCMSSLPTVLNCQQIIIIYNLLCCALVFASFPI